MGTPARPAAAAAAAVVVAVRYRQVNKDALLARPQFHLHHHASTACSTAAAAAVVVKTC
jgi:hypothetical protein